jgi:methionyl-tRNA formyltransferase
MKIILLADKSVGFRIAEWLLDRFKDDVAMIVTVSENNIFKKAEAAGVSTLVFSSTDQLVSEMRRQKIDFTYGILAWWPKIIKEPLLSFPSNGFVNTHPSFLPYNRGKHSNFWALVEKRPFGVSLHFVEAGIDNGDIVAQKQIPYDWTDNGGTLYEKALTEMVELFIRTYPEIRKGAISRTPQQLSKGSFHYANEIEQASAIDLHKRYRAMDLLNMIRARTFHGYPSCWFEAGGQRYEVRINIMRKEGNETD